MLELGIVGRTIGGALGKRGGGAASVVLPATASATIDALQPTFDFALDDQVPHTCTDVACLASGTPTFSLIGAQAAGFDVINASGDARIRLYSREAMLDQGAALGLLKTRVFTLRATVGAAVSDCTVTITLDTSGYRHTDIPSLDTLVGRRSTNPLKDPLVESGLGNMTGWTVNATTRQITQSANNPVELVDFDFTDWRIINTTYNGGSIRECLFAPKPTAYAPQGVQQIYWVDSRNTTTPLSVTDCTWDFRKQNEIVGWSGASTAFTNFSRNALLQCQNDCLNISSIKGVAEDNYASASANNKYDKDTGLPVTNTNQLGHSDALQSFGLTSGVLFNRFLFLCVAHYWKDGATTHVLTGTGSLANGSDIITGTGTDFIADQTAGRIAVGMCIRMKLVQTFIIQEIISATQIRIGQTWTGSARNNIDLRSFAHDDMRTGVTAPLFLQGTGTATLNYELEVRNGIGLGGTYSAQSAIAGGGLDFEQRVIFDNVGFGDYLIAPVASSANLASTAVVTDCWDLHPDTNIADLRPFPVAPSVTQGATGKTYMTLVYTAQDTTVEYEYRIRTTAGPGSWSSWTAVPANKRVSSLTISTSYDLEIRGKNCIATSGTYLQVGPAASVTFATNAGVAYETETNAILAHSGFTSNPAPDDQQDALNELVAAFKTAGIWTLADRLYLLAETVGARGVVNLVSPGTGDATEVGSPTWNANGRGVSNLVAGNYLSTGSKLHFDAGKKFAQNDHTLLILKTDNAGTAFLAGNYHYATGGRGATAGASSRDGSTANNTDVVGTITRCDGLWGMIRSSDDSGTPSTSYKIVGNATASDWKTGAATILATRAVNSAAGVNSETIIGGTNNSNTGTITQFLPPATAAQFAFYFEGEGMTIAQAEAIRVAMAAYFNALGR